MGTRSARRNRPRARARARSRPARGSRAAAGKRDAFEELAAFGRALVPGFVAGVVSEHDDVRLDVEARLAAIDRGLHDDAVTTDALGLRVPRFGDVGTEI